MKENGLDTITHGWRFSGTKLSGRNKKATVLIGWPQGGIPLYTGHFYFWILSLRWNPRLITPRKKTQATNP